MKVQEFATLLFELEVNLHIAHLQTTSFSQHNALNVYKDVVELRDTFLEKYQGEYGIITSYSKMEIREGIDPVKYIEEVCGKIKEFRSTLTEGYLQQLVDNILETLYGTLYFLKNLN